MPASPAPSPSSALFGAPWTCPAETGSRGSRGCLVQSVPREGKDLSIVPRVLYVHYIRIQYQYILSIRYFLACGKKCRSQHKYQHIGQSDNNKEHLMVVWFWSFRWILAYWCFQCWDLIMSVNQCRQYIETLTCIF